MNDQLNQLETSVEGLISAYRELKAQNTALKTELERLQLEKEALEATQKDVAFRLTALDATIQNARGNV